MGEAAGGRGKLAGRIELGRRIGRACFTVERGVYLGMGNTAEVRQNKRLRERRRDKMTARKGAESDSDNLKRKDGKARQNLGSQTFSSRAPRFVE